MELHFKAICTGTEKKEKRDKSGFYYVTRFSLLPSLDVLDVFGDLGIPADMTPRDYVLDGVVKQVFNVSVVSAPTQSGGGVKPGK